MERLHRAWIRRLRQEWGEINGARLEGRLRPPVFAIDPPGRRMGRWDPAGRILALAEHHIWDDPWDEVLETLRHEMAHQVVSELLGHGGERPHGDAFARACEMVGVAPDVRGATRSGPRTRRLLERVRKLLALAGSDNPHEAQAAMAAANTLLLRHNLELPRDEHPGYAYRRLGRSYAALPLQVKMVATLLEEFFFVECIWVQVYNARKDRAERRLEILGTPDNLDVAEHVHEFVHAECERRWSLHREERPRGGARGGGGRGRSRRREFQVGLVHGLSQKLRQERLGNAERGLIWSGDPRLDAFLHERYPRLRRLTSAGVRRSGSYEAGERAGREITIHRPLRERGGGGARRLLE